MNEGWIELVVDGKCQNDRIPKPGTIIIAQLQHWNTKGIVEAELVVVDEDDVTWRTTDDNSEISYDWTVMRYKVKK